MKKLVSLALALLLATALFPLSAAAASDFTVEDGVLVRYTGSSSNVTVPNGVYTVGDGAFEGNTAVKTVTLPDSVHTVGNRAFYNCSSLSQVTGSAVSSVGVFAFNGTPYYDQSTAEFFTLGSCLLWYNGTASQVTLPSGIVSIAPFAFLRCAGLNAFSAPSGLVSVGEGAFYECASLSSVTLPATVEYIGAAAFDGTDFLNKASGFVTLGDGILIRYAGADASVTVPDNIRRIACGAFSDNQKMTALSIPSSVYSIEGGAFEGCKKLSSLTLSRGLVYIGARAFAGCFALGELATPSTLTYIGENAFEGCGLENARLCGTKLMLCENAFKSCTKLRWALLSTDVYAINANAFADCSGLEGISIAPNTMIIDPTALDNCPKVTVYCRERCFAASALRGHDFDCVRGDVDGDGKMSILDATRIQRFLVGLVTFSSHESCASDVDFDAGITILDVTRIQRTLANIV